eukprot:TRINITY_DN8345_c0_g1_i1.p1 TRINITY_DN8345_c0_g1~~TRINITY_DN8345_c0_g1_i1.p1  ORF type:complete len:587 (+),score=122.33 TRINITY_DN8345_c0_g1_i1:105-1865(+)
MSLKIFVRTAYQENDDAVVVSVGLDAVVAEVFHDILPMLFSRDRMPSIPEVQLRVDGDELPLKNRSVLRNLGLNFEEATFVVEERGVPGTPMTPSTPMTMTPHQERQENMTLYSASPKSQRRSSSRHREFYDGKAGSSVVMLANGEGDMLPAPEGRRMVNTEVRSTSCCLPNGMDYGMTPVVPSGTKRDDGLTLLTGGIHKQMDPQRYKKVHDTSPHMQSSVGDWWGHRGGYPNPDKERGVRHTGPPASKKHVWKEGNEGLAGTWQHPVIPNKKAGHGMHPCKEDNIATSQGSMQPNGHAATLHVGKKALSVQQSQLDTDLSPPPQRTNGLKVTEATGKRLAERADHMSTHGHGLGPGLREQMRSKVPLGSEQYLPCEEEKCAARSSKTFKSSVGGLMFTDKQPDSCQPEESVEASMKRKGRPAAPSSFGVRPASPERLEAPPLSSDNLPALRKNIMDKVALYGGHGSKGEMQNAWRHICQGRQALDTNKFCASVASELRVTLKPHEVGQLLGCEVGQVTFKDFCAICKPTNESVINNTPPSGMERKNEYGDRGIKMHGGHNTTSSPPFGVMGDRAPAHRSMRRAF